MRVGRSPNRRRTSQGKQELVWCFARRSVRPQPAGDDKLLRRSGDILRSSCRRTVSISADFSCGSLRVRLRKPSGERVALPTLPQGSAGRSVSRERSKHRVHLSRAGHRGAPAPAAGFDLARQGIPCRLQHRCRRSAEPGDRPRSFGHGRASSHARGRRGRVPERGRGRGCCSTEETVGSRVTGAPMSPQ